MTSKQIRDILNRLNTAYGLKAIHEERVMVETQHGSVTAYRRVGESIYRDAPPSIRGSRHVLRLRAEQLDDRITKAAATEVCTYCGNQIKGFEYAEIVSGVLAHKHCKQERNDGRRRRERFDPPPF